MAYLPSFRALRHQRFFPLLTHLLLFVGVSLFFSFSASGGWMAKFHDKTIMAIVIPGTHDSATHAISRTSSIAKGDDMAKVKWLKGLAPLFIAPWAKAQSLSIAKQLEAGVRYLDLRIVYRDSKKMHYTCHGLYSQKIDTVIEDIKNFIAKNKTEIIIVDIQKLYNMGNTHQELINKFSSAFQGKLADGNCLSKTLGNLAAAGQQIILLCGDSTITANASFLNRGSFIDSKWHEQTSVKGLKEKISAYSAPANKVFVIQAVLTPDGKTIAKGTVPGIAGSLKALAKKVNKELPSWMSEWKSSGKRINVVMVDFITPDLANKIIALN